MDPVVSARFDELLRSLMDLRTTFESSSGRIEQRVATAVVEADNWGGLYDSLPDERVFEPEEEQLPVVTHVVPDGWGGLFDDVPDEPVTEFDYFPDAFDSISSAFGAAATEFDSIDKEPACLTRIASAAILKRDPEESPPQIQERVELGVDEKVLSSTGSKVLEVVVARSNTDQILTERGRVSALDIDSLTRGALSAPRPQRRAPPRRPRPRWAWGVPRLRRPRRAPLLHRPRRLPLRPRRPRPTRRPPRRRRCSSTPPPVRLRHRQSHAAYARGGGVRTRAQLRRLDSPDFGLSKRGPIGDLASVPAWGGTAPTPAATGGAEISIALAASPRLSGSACVFSSHEYAPVALGAVGAHAVDAEGYARSLSMAANAYSTGVRRHLSCVVCGVTCFPHGGALLRFEHGVPKLGKGNCSTVHPRPRPEPRDAAACRAIRVRACVLLLASVALAEQATKGHFTKAYELALVSRLPVPSGFVKDAETCRHTLTNCLTQVLTSNNFTKQLDAYTMSAPGMLDDLRALVPVGIVFTTWEEPSFHLFGFVMYVIVTDMTCCALRTVLQEILLMSEEDKMDSMDLFCYMVPMTVLTLEPATLAQEHDTFRVMVNLARMDPSFLDIPILKISAALLSDGHHHHVQIDKFSFSSDHDTATMHAISEFCDGKFPFIDAEGSMQDGFAQRTDSFLSIVVKKIQLGIEYVDNGVLLSSIKSDEESRFLFTLCFSWVAVSVYGLAMEEDPPDVAQCVPTSQMQELSVDDGRDVATAQYITSQKTTLKWQEFLAAGGSMREAALCRNSSEATTFFANKEMWYNVDCLRFLQFSWDPGPILQHRLGGKPSLKEGGMSGTIHAMDLSCVVCGVTSSKHSFVLRFIITLLLLVMGQCTVELRKASVTLHNQQGLMQELLASDLLAVDGWTWQAEHRRIVFIMLLTLTMVHKLVPELTKAMTVCYIEYTVCGLGFDASSPNQIWKITAAA